MYLIEKHVVQAIASERIYIRFCHAEIITYGFSVVKLVEYFYSKITP